MTSEKEYLANKVKEIKKLIGDKFGDKFVAFVPEEYIAVTSLDIANALHQLIEDLKLDRFYLEDELCEKCSTIIACMESYILDRVRKAFENDRK